MGQPMTLDYERRASGDLTCKTSRLNKDAPQRLSQLGLASAAPHRKANVGDWNVMHVVVIGSGIVGSSIAYECAKAGARVTVFDAGKMGGDASAVSFAWTNATSKNPRSYFALNVAGMRAHLELRRDFGDTPWFAQTGSLEWRTTEEGRQWQAENFEQMREWGYGVEWIDRRKLAEKEPDIDPAAIGDNPIAYYPEEGWIDPLVYAAWLLRAAASRWSVTLRPGTAIASVETEGGRAVAVRTAGGERVPADAVVNCTGSRSDVELGVPAIPLASTIGVLAFTPPVATTLRSQFHADDLDVRTDGAGRLMIHKISVEKPFSEPAELHPDGPEALALLEAARHVLPMLEGVESKRYAPPSVRFPRMASRASEKCRRWRATMSWSPTAASRSPLTWPRRWPMRSSTAASMTTFAPSGRIASSRSRMREARPQSLSARLPSRPDGATAEATSFHP